MVLVTGRAIAPRRRLLLLMLLLALLAMPVGAAMAKAPTSAIVPPLEVSGHTQVGLHPEGVAIDPGLGIAVVANRNDHSVSLVDLDTRSEVKRVRVGIRPVGVAVNPRTHRAVVTNSAAGTVSVVDLQTQTVERTIRVGRHPVAVAIHAGQNRAFVANFNSDDVSVIELVTGAVVTNVRVGRKPAGIAINETTGTAAVTSRGDDSITFLRLDGRPEAQGVLPLDPLPSKKWRHQPIGVAFDTVTNTLVVANSGSWTVGILSLNAANEAVEQTFTAVGKRPIAVAALPGGNLALVSSDKDDVFAVDLTDRTLVGRATVQRQPSGIAVDDTRCRAVVTNRTDNTVSHLGARCRAALRLTAISPSAVQVGGNAFVLTLSGTGFVPGSVVHVDGGAPLTPITVSSTAITVTVPAGLIAAIATLPVSVTVPAGETSNSLPLTVADTPPPLLTQIFPSTGIANFTDFGMTLTGANFLPGAQAEIAGFPVPGTTYVSSTEVRAVVPGALLSEGGTLDVAVVNPGGARTNTLPFLVTNPLPVLSLITPNNAVVGGGDVNVVMTGNDFVLTSEAYWCPRNTANDIQVVRATCTRLVSAAFPANPAVQVNAVIPGSLLVIPQAPDGQPPYTQYVWSVKVFNPPPGGGFSYEQPFTVTNPTLPPGYSVAVIAKPGSPMTDPHPARVALFRAGTAGQSTLAAAVYDGYGAVEIVDVTNRNPLGMIALPSVTLGDIDVNRNTGTVVVTSGANDTVYVIEVNVDNPATSAYWPVAVGGGTGTVWPFGVAVNPTTNQAVVTNLFSNSLSVIDLATRTVVDTIALHTASAITFVGVNSATNTAVVVDVGDAISAGWGHLVDLGRRRVVGQATLGVWPSFVAVNPVTDVAVVSNSFSDVSLNDSISVISMANGTGAEIALHEEPAGVAIDPSTNTARVATQRSNQIFLVDLAAMQVVPGDTLQLGFADAVSPSDIAWDPAAQLMITTSATSNNYVVVEYGVPAQP